MRRTLHAAAIAAACFAFPLAGCNSPAGQSALAAGAALGSQLAATECAKLTKTSAALATACVTAAGDLIDIASAQARGLVARQ
jgi:hypothetical protein